MITPLSPASPAAQDALSRRIVHTDAAIFRQLTAVHGGAGSMAFTALLDRGAVTPEFNFLHRGAIPPGARPVQWMNLNVSLVGGVYDAFDLGDTRARAPLDPVLPHTAVGEAYYVLAGTGTVTVKGAASETAPIRTGDAIAIRIGKSSLFVNTGSEALELLVMGVARDVAAKTQLLSGSNQR